MRSLRRTILLGVALAGLALNPPAQGAAPGVVVVGSGQLFGQSGRFVSELGVGWARAFVPWSSFEPAAGRLDESRVQGLEGWLAGLPQGTRVILDVVRTPSWESGSSDPAAPPRHPGDYASFIGTMARHFAGRVAAWEIWNEEDASQWWASGPDAAAYTALLRSAYQAVKAADPQAVVVLGGLTGNDYEFLTQLYEAGAKGSFDAVAVHTDTLCHIEPPYDYLRNPTGTPYEGQVNRWSFLGYQTVHEVMVAHGDLGPIWMTELGWSTYPAVCNAGAGAGKKPGGVSDAQQAAYLLQAYHCLAHDPYVQVGIWYGLQDAEPFDSPRGYYGLLNSSLAPKPAFAALAEYAHRGDRLTEACGEFNGPSIKLARPVMGAHYTGTLPIMVGATDPLGVHQISLYHDGVKIRNFTNPTPTPALKGRMVWFGARHISPGRHVLTVTADDSKGTKSSISIVIYHLAANQHPGRHARCRVHHRHTKRRCVRRRRHRHR